MVLLHAYILTINFGDVVMLKGGKQGVILPKNPGYQLNAIQELPVKGSRIAPFVSKEKAGADAACTVLLTCTCSSLARKIFAYF